MTQNNINTSSRLMQFLSTSTASTFICNTSAFSTSTDTIPQNTVGTEIITLSITPVSASSTLVITSSAMGTINGAADWAMGLWQDTTADALAAVRIRADRNGIIRHIMTSGTTSPTTFKMRAGSNTVSGGAASVNINADAAGTRLMGGVELVWLIIEEYL